MKIKIISIHDIGNNFGSTLQACALYDYVKILGYSNIDVINYKPKCAYHHGKIGQFIKSILFFKDVFNQRKRFREYYENHSNLTKEYTSYEQLEQENDGDVYIVGSDQVWNEYYDAGRDMAYYLKFTNSRRKMAYASSIGQLQSDDALDRLCLNIEDFRFISVREGASVIQLKNRNFNKVEHVLDPVFLHDKEYYIDNKFKNMYGNYLLIYAVNTDPNMDRIASEIAKRLKLKIVLVGGFLQKYKCDYYLRDIGPKEFTNLIYNADYVVANSFHASAFCLMFNKQFALIKPNVSSLRLVDLLQTVGIQNRFITCIDDVKDVILPIDYRNVNINIQRLQSKSREYLKNALFVFSEEVLNEDKV